MKCLPLWKLEPFRMLLQDYNQKDRYFDILTKTQRTEADVDGLDVKLGKELNANCLIWCLNIGLQNNALVGIKKDTEFESEDNEQEDNEHISDSIGIKTAYNCFKLILECTKYKDNEINRLVNERTVDGLHLAEVCVSQSSKYPQFIEYLIKNNGKYDWNIDFKHTNILQLAMMVGDYRTLKTLVNINRIN